MPKKTLNVLILEDSESDAELMVRELRRSGYAPDWKRVETESDFRDSLNPNLDLILSDYLMPQFNGLRALELLNQQHLDIPFVIVSGSIGEDIAVKAMQQGAADYLLKDRLARLGQAVEHALEQKRLEDERRRAEEEVKALTRQHELILNSVGDGIHGINLEGNIIFENPKAGELLGWKPNELIGKPAHATIHHNHPDGSAYPIEKCPIYASMRDGTTRRVTNDVFWRKDGSSFRVDYVAAPVRDGNGKIRGSIVTFKDITEEFAAEQRLKLQEQQYRLLFQTNPNPMWVFDVKTLGILAVNDAAVAQYGYSREEFLKLSLRDLRSSEDARKLEKAISAPHEPAHFSGEFRHKRKDSSEILVEIYSSPMIWDGVTARMVTAIDVTERKQSERRIRESEERFRLITETVQDVFWLSKPDMSKVFYVSPAYERLWGRTRESLYASSKSFLEAIHPDDRERIYSKIPGHQKGEWNQEYRIVQPDGTVRWIKDRGFPVRAEDGTIQYMTGVASDITERKRAEERLREQANIIDRAHDAVIVRNFKDDQITVWNNGAERLYGWTASEAIGLPASELIFKGSTKSAELMDRLVLTGEFHGEVKHRTKDGREVIVDSRVTLIRNDDSTPRSVLGINSDVTEKKRLETQLLRAQRLESIGTLASGVAHDLNNVLTPILMCSEILRRQLSTPDGEKTIKLIEGSARRGASIVKQVLTFARGVEGERVLIKPSHLIEELIDIAKKTFPKSIEISSRYPEDLWMIQGDPTQLHQVLLNLSVNARDAMPDGGSLLIWAENINVDENYAAMMPGASAGAYVSIRVSDTGSGMSRTTVEKIFDPFFTTKEVGKGTGLGLSTALGIVKSHAGFISVYSEVDKGTTFRIFLPAKMTDEGLSHSETPAESLQGNNELVLVVDDEQGILSVTQMILENKGYRVITAHDGPEAVAVFAQEKDAIQVVLTDMALPFMDGVALIRSLKKIKPSTPFIASTGQSAHSYASELEKLGVKNLLTKPYDTQKLLEVLHDTLGARKG